MRLDHKVAVVTGGASGIGAAIATLFAAEGATVVIFDKQAGVGLQCDVTREADVRDAMAEVVRRHGRIDILVNNAGAAIRRTAADQDEESWDVVIDTNLKGAYLCSRFALPRMERGGVIIHISSVAGIMGLRNRAAYCSSKAGVVGLMRNMALDYAPRGIRVNCVCPGFVRTPFIRHLLEDPARTASLTALHPLGRLGEPEDIARAALFLASEDGAWITGQAIAVDGGLSVGHQADV